MDDREKRLHSIRFRLRALLVSPAAPHFAGVLTRLLERADQPPDDAGLDQLDDDLRRVMLVIGVTLHPTQDGE
jgi:hypothetical protein